jgi:hypothetical protein
VTSNRRYTFAHSINHIDLGLRLDDLIIDDETRLESEPVALKSDKGTLAKRLRINGARQAEIEFLLAGPDKVGQRVELNAMTSGQFIAFVERKLEAHGIAKVVPESDFLARTYTAFKRGTLASRALQAQAAGASQRPAGHGPRRSDRSGAGAARRPSSRGVGRRRAGDHAKPADMTQVCRLH